MNPRRRWAAIAVIPTLGLLGFVDMRDERPDFTTTPTSTVPAVVLDRPAEPVAAAVRVLPPTTTVPPATGHTASDPLAVFDCAAYVNALPYEWRNLEPAREAYRVTAACTGWHADTIERWEAFVVDDVIRGESGGCWNMRFGAVVDQWAGCVLDRQGSGDASGFGQIVALWWHGPGAPVCDRLGLCTSDAVISSPWNSMRALLVAVEHHGRGPWCYDLGSRRLHWSCASTPRRWPS